MRLYLDVCCLKRPFDDQGQPRVRIESEAVLALLGAPADRVELLHAPAQDLENDQNPPAWRAAIVRAWLDARPALGLDVSRLATRTEEIMRLGFRGFDALHLASAELAAADVFVTVDDRVLAKARSLSGSFRVRVLDPVSLAEEVFP